MREMVFAHRVNGFANIGFWVYSCDARCEDWLAISVDI